MQLLGGVSQGFGPRRFCNHLSAPRSHNAHFEGQVDPVGVPMAGGILDVPHRNRESVTTPEELAMAAVEIRRGYVAVKEAGRQEGFREGLQEGFREGLQKGLLTGARQAKVDMLCEALQPAVGRQFVGELRVWIEVEELLARLDISTIIDLRIRYGAEPDSLRQAVRNLLGKA